MPFKCLNKVLSQTYMKRTETIYWWKHLSGGRWCTFKYTQYFISDECFNFLQGSSISLKTGTKVEKKKKTDRENKHQHNMICRLKSAASKWQWFMFYSCWGRRCKTWQNMNVDANNQCLIPWLSSKTPLTRSGHIKEHIVQSESEI